MEVSESNSQVPTRRSLRFQKPKTDLERAIVTDDDDEPDNAKDENFKIRGDENGSSGSEDESENEENSSEDESEGSAGRSKSTGQKLTSKHKNLRCISLTEMALTPEVLRKVAGRSVKRKLAVDSPVAKGSQTMTPNPETYFMAETRIKYRKEVKLDEHVMNDAAKGKKRRKKLILKVDNRPEKYSSNFSVTTEALRAQIESKNFVAGSTHDEEVEKLMRNVVDNDFPHWLGLFRDGFNVMLYGYGSKLGIFKEFENFLNDKYLIVSINGLFPNLNSRKLLYGICDHVSPSERVPRGSNIEAVAREAVRILKKENHPDIFIIINSFDSLALRVPQLLTILCLLAQIPYIHILGSCDTVNAFLGVTQSQALQLRFCWMHCPTFQQYRAELKWHPGINGDEAKTVTQKSSLKYVLQSLTGNARKAFALLGQMQLKQMKVHAAKKTNDGYAGVRFQELAKECREKFIAHSDENLRTLLVEFFDHKLIKQTAKGRHIENSLLIELDIETLEEVILEFT